MKPIDLSKILSDFQGKWVALSNDESSPAVFGSSVTAKDAVKDAESNGSTDFYLLYVRPFDLLFSGASL